MKKNRRRGRPKIETLVVDTLFKDEIYSFDTDTTCTFCNAEFVDIDDLKIHIQQIHVNENNKYRCCGFCSAFYKDIESLCVHLRDEHICHIKCCELCTRAFTNDSLFKNHLNNHYNFRTKSMFKCSQCPDQFHSLLELEEHEIQIHPKAEGVLLQRYFTVLSSVLNVNARNFLLTLGKEIHYVCIQCNFSSSDLIEYINHLQVNDCRSFVCDNCCYVFKTKHSLVAHVTRHEECKAPNTFRTYKKQCPECFKDINYIDFTKHKRSCKAIKCKICEIIFNSLEELANHQRNNHSRSIDLQNCKYCKKEYVGSDILEKHIKQAHGNSIHLYKYKCVYCNDIYPHPKNLFTHFYTKHKDIKPYICKLCDKTFRVRKKFSLHIKLDHKSGGNIEFNENFHVYFTERKNNQSNHDASQLNIAVKKLTPHEDSAEHLKPTASEIIETDNIVTNETELDLMKDLASATETDEKLSEKFNLVKDKVKKKRMITKLKREKRKRKQECTSSDEDKPLIVVKKKAKRKLASIVRRAAMNGICLTEKKQSFICNICKKNCFTFQNYHNHVSSHFVNETKKCIKCSKTFGNYKELKEHIDNDHTTSKLIDTLKNLLNKRKINEFKAETMAEKFQKTIKKVEIDNNYSAATIKSIDTDQISVQKFIENFMPETSDANKTNVNLNVSVSMKVISRPLLKQHFTVNIKKCDLDSSLKCTKLAMPVRYQPPCEYDEHKVSIKLVETKDEYFDDDMSCHDSYIGDLQIEPAIPDVAEEIMLEESVETNQSAQIPASVPHKIVITNMPKQLNDVSIAHLHPEAPYYKIVKVTDLLNKKSDNEQNIKKEEPERLQLPGTKLVNVNPLAHLISEKTVESLVQTKNKYYRYKAKSNYQNAVAQALALLEDKKHQNKLAKTKGKLIQS